MRAEAYALTDPGPVREQNEDFFAVREDEGLFLLADGMGGHAAGEVAAQLAVETVRDIILGELDPEETRLDRVVEDYPDMLRERMRYAMNQASLRIRQEALANPAYAGMGTTLCLLLIEDGMAHLAHVGDSRIYLYRAGRLQRLTRDHTVVQMELDAGRISPELARVVPHKNILTQSVGFHGPVEPDTSTRPVLDGDIFMVCSDGLSDPLDDDELTTVFQAHDAPELPDALVRAALDAGGDDNVTVVVVQLRDE
jgi:serine/threonine protein phosphatase PrpC